ncbi:sigma-54-dependent Fis family transcriptional regulator [Oscillatoria sp. FACHB-1407]|nr:sigma-54-dependent Fis family transcriptional regulator [Oscillatoria sp. FACHB-1407]
MSSSSKNAWEAGRLYRSTRAISAQLLRSPIHRAWERSHLQGANPRAMQAEQLSVRETEQLLEQNRDLINAARPYFRMLSQAAGQERHAVMLGDRNAIVLGVMGDDQTINGPEPFPNSGSLLSEGIAGANGIGTSLAEAGYVEIAATEHFIEGFHPFTCQGIPLYNEKREVTGVFSISVRRPEVGQRLKEILLCASHGIEADLMVANLEKDIRQVLAASPDDYQPLEKLKQDLIQSHQAARLKLEMSSRLVARSRLDYALQLVQQAEQSIQLFRRRANLWHDLASSQRGIVQSICITDKLDDLIDLLKTEIAIRRVELVPCWTEPIRVLADHKELIRQLLRYFLKSFEQMVEGDSVAVRVEKLSMDGLVQVSFSINPELHLIKESRQATLVLTFPLAT